jgi:hypothetical protein
LEDDIHDRIRLGASGNTMHVALTIR